MSRLRLGGTREDVGAEEGASVDGETVVAGDNAAMLNVQMKEIEIYR